MANLFNISVKPEIAALESKVDIVDTVVDAIRSTDVPNIQTNINDNETKIDTIDSEVGTIDTVVDAIKAKTDALPQNVRGKYYESVLNTTSATFQIVSDISGHGKIVMLAVTCANAGDTLECRVTVDTAVFTVIAHTGDVLTQALVNHPQTGAGMALLKLAAPPTTVQDINVEYNSSFRVEIRRSAGAAGNVTCKCQYTLDMF